MSGLPESVENDLFKIPHKDLSIYKSDNIYNCDMRIIIQGSVREDTRSRFQIGEGGKIKNLTIRLPPVDNARDRQDKIMEIARNSFGKKAGCYGRTGNLHIRYPIHGQLEDYGTREFLSDFNEFESEIDAYVNFLDNEE